MVSSGAFPVPLALILGRRGANMALLLPHGSLRCFFISLFCLWFRLGKFCRFVKSTGLSICHCLFAL